jgi:hypothetical protein
MTVSKRLARLTTLTAALVGSGCDAGDSAEATTHDFDLQFRDDSGDRTGPDKLNTNYFGVEDHPFNNLPLVPGGEASMEIVEIRGHSCVDPSGGLLNLQVSTLPVSPDVSLAISSEGVLGALTVAPPNDPGTLCTISGDLWEGTRWEVRIHVGEDPQVTIETDLRLHDVSVDEHGSTVYRWLVNYTRMTGASGGKPLYVPTCDEDVETPVDPALAYHAYLVPGLHVDPESGDFLPAPVGNTPSTAFLACRSGAIGKAISWGYAPWDIGTSHHELATRMVRADYCGNGVSYTQSGTPIWLQDTLGVWDGVPPQTYAREAGWSESAGAAVCLTQARLAATGTVTCPGGELPLCTENLLALSDIVTSVP